ncbi:MAG: ATP-binding protein [Lachnospiraceae bacterium]|nr:ATP-binding protein [Lachnospiraceae bacterium]
MDELNSNENRTVKQNSSTSNTTDNLNSADVSGTPDIAAMHDSLNTVWNTYREMLSYFQTAYVTQSEQVQSLKSELIELDVKIEELQKTRDLYSFQSDNSRTIFSPIPIDSEHRTKGQLIQDQIRELQEIRNTLTDRIANADNELASIMKHIDSLKQTNTCLTTLSDNLPKEEEPKEVEEVTTVEAPPEEPDDSDIRRAWHLLMLQQYDKSQTALQIQNSIVDGLDNNKNKLEVLKWLIQSDPTRARVTLQELQDANDRLIQNSNRLIRRLNRSLTHQLPVWKAIDEMVQSYRSRYPEVTINSSVDCQDYNIQTMPIITITVLQLLQEILDNSFRYSNANRILIQVYMNSRMIDIYINDNGVGIPADYLTASNWHSGLHKVQDIIHLLDGKLQIDGDIISGTNIRFSFPICPTETNNSEPPKTKS